MLILSRKVGESLIIGDACLQVVKIGNGNVRVGITADRSVRVIRSELDVRDNSGPDQPSGGVDDMRNAPGDGLGLPGVEGEG